MPLENPFHRPLYSDYGNQIRHFANMINFVGEIPEFHKLGPVKFETDLLRLALITECQNWKRAFGVALNNKASGDMDSVFDTVEDQKKRLSRPINDLDDIRSSMASLQELREKEIFIEMTIGPVEECFALLNRYELAFDDGNQERVDTIGYAWKNVQTQAKERCFEITD
jgi:dynein heavy chain